jgi:uncharacterized OB-fold protein
VTTEDTEKPFRLLPRVDTRSGFFWKSGADGKLRFLRCAVCGTFAHPPQPLCPSCHSKEVSPEAVSGRATLATYTINHQPWMPGPELPYVVAIVEIEEQPDVRLMTNLVNCPLDDIRIGMPVRVVFEQHDDPDEPESPGVFLPLFEPDPESAR